MKTFEPRVLYIGESWLGSCARSMKEALSRRPSLQLDEINEDAWFPRPRARWLRAVNRLTAHVYRGEFEAHVLQKVREFKPDVVVAYKGWSISESTVREIRRHGVFTANIYPDYSPHAYGKAHRYAVGAYDLIISTKPYHPGLWRELYGYTNKCIHVAHGYDPFVHLVHEAPSQFSCDVVIVATYRPEYEALLLDFAAEINDPHLTVVVGGYGWSAARARLPSHWQFPGPSHGRGYVSLLRRGKICIAPLTRDVVIAGKSQPGDVDTTRTYELAAAHCFFLHRRTDYAVTLYTPDEVPMFSDARELATLVKLYLADESRRTQMAVAAHQRAVPNYSIDSRANEIVRALRAELEPS